jgi:hypothetical protein
MEAIVDFLPPIGEVAPARQGHGLAWRNVDERRRTDTSWQRPRWRTLAAMSTFLALVAFAALWPALVAYARRDTFSVGRATARAAADQRTGVTSVPSDRNRATFSSTSRPIAARASSVALPTWGRTTTESKASSCSGTCGSSA